MRVMRKYVRKLPLPTPECLATGNLAVIAVCLLALMQKE